MLAGPSIILASPAQRPTPTTTPPASKNTRPLETANGPPVFGRPSAGAARLGVAPAWAGAGEIVAVALGIRSGVAPLPAVLVGSGVGVELGIAVGVAVGVAVAVGIAV